MNVANVIIATIAPKEDPQAPPHCLEDMDLITPVE